MTVAKCGSETWVLRKMEDDLLDVFLKNCLWIVVGIRLNDLIANSKLCKKCGCIPLPKASVRVDMDRTRCADEG